MIFEKVFKMAMFKKFVNTSLEYSDHHCLLSLHIINIQIQVVYQNCMMCRKHALWVLRNQSTMDKLCISKKNEWILDSGCSRHMTGNPKMLKDIIYKDGGLVNFGDNSKGYVIDIGKVGNSETPIITNVFLC